MHNAFGEAVLAGRPELGRPPEITLGFRRLHISQDTSLLMSNPRFGHFVVDDVAGGPDEAVQDSQHRAQPAKVRLRAAHTAHEVENIVRGTYLNTYAFIPNHLPLAQTSVTDNGVKKALSPN